MIQTAESKKKRMAPYVPPSVLSAFFDHIRYVKEPETVDSNLVQDYGLPRGHAWALLSTLKFLDLTDARGVPTPAFRLLQTGGEEFQTNLREIVQRSYSDLFSRLDVSRDSRDKILNFFARNYSPATAERATRLFLDLCGEAGIPTAAKEPRKVTRQNLEPARAKQPRLIPEDQGAVDEKPNSPTMESERLSQPGVHIHIDSKDLVSMNPQQIEALFKGLSNFTSQGKNEADKKGTG